MNTEFKMPSAFIWFGILTSIIFFLQGCTNFTTENDLALFRKKFEQEKDYSEKRKTLFNLLDDIHNPKTNEDDQVVNYFFDMIGDMYISSNDIAIVSVIDEFPIEGGFANSLCGFYKKIKSTKSFSERYRSDINQIKLIERCEGISFSRDELDQLRGH